MKVSASQMAKGIGVSRQSVIRWCSLGLLGPDAEMIGGRWIINWHDFLFDGSALEHWIDPTVPRRHHAGAGRPVGSKDLVPRGLKRRLECRAKLEGHKFLCDKDG